MEKKLIGYKVKPEFKEAAEKVLLKGDEYDIGSDKNIDFKINSYYYNFFKKLGVLDIWFDKVYEDDKLEVNRWYKRKSFPEALICFQRIKDGGVINGYGFVGLGDWCEDYRAGRDVFDFYPATDKEVEDALIKEAKKRGVKEGVKFNCVKYGGKLHTYTGGKICLYNNYLIADTKEGNRMIFADGKWAEIVEEKLEINGYEPVFDNMIVTFGCAVFSINQLEKVIQFNNFERYYGDRVNRKIKSITLDSGVELTIEQIKQIVDKYNQQNK